MIDLATLRALEDEATAGPWTAELDKFNDDEGLVATFTDAKVSFIGKIETDLGVGDFEGRIDQWHADCAAARDCQEMRDAAFIAAAREAVPALCDEVERLRALVADAADVFEKLDMPRAAALYRKGVK